MDKLKVLIADDTIVYRKILAEAVEGTGLGVVARSASNGAIALEWLKQGGVDVVLLDVFMPEVDGIEALKVIKREYPDIVVIMISSGGSDNAAVTLEALKLGAMDFILKPSEASYDKNMDRIRNQLQVLFAQIKIKRFSASPVQAYADSMLQSSKDVKLHAITSSPVKPIINKWAGADLVLVASSTGGPAALETVFGAFPASFKKPVLVVQHMPPEFTRILAETLDRKYQIKAVEGKNEDFVSNNQIIIAPGGFHMEVVSRGNEKVIALNSQPFVNGVRPAADVLFTSVAKAYEGKNILAVILTGMGNDGAQGVAELKRRCNCICLTQTEASCVVYGMPRCVAEAGLSDEAVDLKDMGARILQLV
ncbi:MAG: chemotaxis-specific protein-glutamate methyltransferase CheB [Clostridia bacterium]|nr:chemotaxis-specific protein-glutamate methyltransferase CheB [Clostridia bacterium]